ncbi:MAG: hypothetical protein ACRDI2_24000 [Chloroflexota bacterium]
MKLCVAFDEEDLARTAERKSRLYFGIYWQGDGNCYPGYNWRDFGVVILLGWFHVLLELYDGATDGVFYFMDGPYAIDVRPVPGTDLVEFAPRDENWRTTMSLSGLAEQLLTAAQAIDGKLAAMAIAQQERESLAAGVHLLQEKMDSAQHEPRLAVLHVSE